MASSRILIAGGNGLIGSRLAQKLRERGETVDILTRGDTRVIPGDKPLIWIHWEPGVMLEISPEDHYDVVINLAGESLSHIPWTKKRKAAIIASRLESTQSLVNWMEHAVEPPRLFISGSAVGYYGSRGDEDLTEESDFGTGFLANLTQAWEKITDGIPAQTRVAFIRTGIVLAQSGALTPLRKLTSMFLGGKLGSGKQWWPWISLDDEVRAIMHIIDNEIHGPVNLVGPTPATQEEGGRALAAALKRPFWLPAPGFAINLLLGDAGRELLLTSQKVHPTVLEGSGFVFEHTTVEQAIAAALEVPEGVAAESETEPAPVVVEEPETD